MLNNEAPRASPWHPSTHDQAPKLDRGAKSRTEDHHSSTGKPVVFWRVDKKSKLIFLSALFLFFLSPNLVFALEIIYPRIPGALAPQDFIGTAPPEQIIPLYFAYIFNLILWISGIIAFGSLVYAGIRYLLSAGKPEAIVAAKTQIIDTFFGVLLLLSSFLILQILNPRLLVLEIPRLERPRVVERPEIPPPPTESYRSSIDAEIPFGAVIEEVFKEERRTRIRDNSSATLDIASDIKESNEELDGIVQGNCRCENARPQCNPCVSGRSCTCDTCDPVRDDIEDVQNNENLPNIELLRQEQEKTIEEIRLLQVELDRLEKSAGFMNSCPLSKLNSLAQFLDTKKVYISHKWPVFDTKFLELIRTIEEWASFYCPVSGSIEGEQFAPPPGITEELPSLTLPEGVEESTQACTTEVPVGEIIDRTKRVGQLLVSRMEELVAKNKEMIEAVEEIQVLVSQCTSQVPNCYSVCIQYKGRCVYQRCHGNPCPFSQISSQASEINRIQEEIEALVEEEGIEEMGIIPIIDTVAPAILEDLAKEVRKPMKECITDSAVAEQNPDIPQAILSNCQDSLRSIGPKGVVIQNCCLAEPEFQQCLDKCYLEEGQENYKGCLRDCLSEKSQNLRAAGRIRESEIIATCNHTMNFYCCGK